MPGARATAAWRTVVISGACLLALALGALGADFSVLENYSDGLSLAALIGTMALVVGLLGWAAVLERRGRTRLGFRILIASVAVCGIGILLGGTNLHGSLYLFVLPMIPVSAVGLIVLVMAAIATRN